MTQFTRRHLITTTGATLASTALGAPAIAASARKIQRRVDKGLNFIDRNLPDYAHLLDISAAVILIPRITAAGLFIGGAYGEGALLEKRNIVDYYAFAMANYGFQFGIQQYGSALFLRTQETVDRFRNRDGFTLGVDLQFTAVKEGEIASVDTTTGATDATGLVYGKKGVVFGLTIDGAKYTRIER